MEHVRQTRRIPWMIIPSTHGSRCSCGFQVTGCTAFAPTRESVWSAIRKPNQKPNLEPMKTMQNRVSLAATASLCIAMLGQAGAAEMEVPNGSFESPTPPAGFPVNTQIDVWKKSPQPAGVPLPGGITWAHPFLYRCKGWRLFNLSLGEEKDRFNSGSIFK